jgi:methanogenic corrinoid protein MtbC1
LSEALSASRLLSPEALEQDYLDALLRPDLSGARALVDAALAGGLPTKEAYLRVIAPAMHEIGRLWETAQISVAQEHLATQISQIVLAGLGLRLGAAGDVGCGRVAIVASTPGEMHALATQMVGDFLEIQGWDVLALGANVPAQELVELARQRQATLVALSTALPGHLLSVTRTCQRLRQLEQVPYIVVGGRAYRGDAGQAVAVGADAFVSDPDALLAHLAEVFGSDAGA